MSIGPTGGIAGSAAGSPLAQTSGSEVERAQQDAASQKRRIQMNQKAENAAGIGETTAKTTRRKNVTPTADASGKSRPRPSRRRKHPKPTPTPERARTPPVSAAICSTSAASTMAQGLRKKGDRHRRRKPRRQEDLVESTEPSPFATANRLCPTDALIQVIADFVAHGRPIACPAPRRVFFPRDGTFRAAREREPCQG